MTWIFVELAYITQLANLKENTHYLSISGEKQEESHKEMKVKLPIIFNYKVGLRIPMGFNADPDSAF